MLLYPQLPHAVSQQLAEDRRALSVPAAAAMVDIDHPGCMFSPTGGTRVDADRLRSLRNGITRAATDLGYPQVATERRRSVFDVQAAMVLHRDMDISPSEAAKSGVWEFLSCILLSDVVVWRWTSPEDSSAPSDRFLAGRRNTFQRLWWRALFLYHEGAANPYGLVGRLGEDEIVQIMERPNLAGNRRLSRTIAEELLAASERHPGIARRVLIRETQKRIRRLAAFSSLEAVDDVEIRQVVRESFEMVASAIDKERR